MCRMVILPLLSPPPHSTAKQNTLVNISVTVFKQLSLYLLSHISVTVFKLKKKRPPARVTESEDYL